MIINAYAYLKIVNLRKAYQVFLKDKELKKEYRTFVKGTFWLKKYARFMALNKANEGLPWVGLEC